MVAAEAMKAAEAAAKAEAAKAAEAPKAKAAEEEAVMLAANANAAEKDATEAFEEGAAEAEAAAVLAAPTWEDDTPKLDWPTREEAEKMKMADLKSVLVAHGCAGTPEARTVVPAGSDVCARRGWDKGGRAVHPGRA
eukprot:1932986-Prymnesium_polylepis.1